MGNIRLTIAGIVLCWTATALEAHQAQYPTVPMKELLKDGYEVVYSRWLRTNLYFFMKKDEDIAICTYHGGPKEAHKNKDDYQSFAYCDAPKSKLRLWNDGSKTLHTERPMIETAMRPICCEAGGQPGRGVAIHSTYAIWSMQ